MADSRESLQSHLADRYRIERELGRGGMGTVYLAEDLRHHRRVAIKVLEPDLAAALGRERFLREIETVARLAHPHVLPLHDSGEAGGILYYVMPYVEGESLQARLAREKQLPVDEALRIAREVADALAYAHAQGVVHRDIKPGNILLQSGHAVVADFGLARAIASAGVDPAAPTGAGTLTAPGSALGTPAYMSPEQAAGSRDVDGRSDLYSLGCVLYEMLAGQPPFTGATVESLVHQHLSVAPRPVTDLRPAVPAAVRDALARALAKMPADRFATTAEFAGALVTGSASPGSVAPGSLPQSRSRDRARAFGSRVTFAATAAALAVTLVAVAAWQRWGPFAGWLGSSTPASLHERRWLLVADFEGPTEDPSIARAAKQIVSASLSQSPVLATVTDEQVVLALQQSGRPDTVRLTPKLARELAVRRGVRMVLEGEITRLGDRYAVTLRVDDVERDGQVLAVSEDARSQQTLFEVLGRMAGRIRKELGEAHWATPMTRRFWYIAPTPSFEAYKLWADGIRLGNEMDYAGALRQYRAALAIDPDFATAWAYAADAYRALGISDSVGVALLEALRRPERLDPNDRLSTEGDLAAWQGDWRTALEIWQRIRRLYPEDAVAENRIETTLGMQGDLKGALDANSERILKAGPMGVPPLVYLLRIGWLTALGRFGSARAEADKLQGAPRRQAELNLALAERNWSRADSVANAVERDPRSSVTLLVSAAGARASTAAVAGRLSAAEACLRRASELEHDRGRRAIASRAGRAGVTLALASGRPVPAPAAWLERDTTTSALITRVYAAAARGDTTTARRQLAELRSRGSTRLGAHGSTPEFLEACIAARAGRWADVVSLIAKAALEGTDRGSGSWDRIGVAPERLLVAQAYEQLGRPDSAAAFYSSLLDPDNPARTLDSIARLKIVVLSARMGRSADAERHLAILKRDISNPDPDVARMLDEARAAVRVRRGLEMSQLRQ